MAFSVLIHETWITFIGIGEMEDCSIELSFEFILISKDVIDILDKYSAYIELICWIGNWIAMNTNQFYQHHIAPSLAGHKIILANQYNAASVRPWPPVPYDCTNGRARKCHYIVFDGKHYQSVPAYWDRVILQMMEMNWFIISGRVLRRPSSWPGSMMCMLSNVVQKLMYLS